MSKNSEQPGDPAEMPADTIPTDPAAGAPPPVDAGGDAKSLAQLEDRLLRLAAEYDNFRKRTAREKTEAFDRGAGALVVRFLDVLDDMDRLAQSDPATTSYESFRGAFDLLQKKLRKELEAAGLERIDAAGAPFDPSLHDAVAVAPVETPEQDHTVKATFQVGYRFKGSVIRPARVQVYSEQGNG